MAIIKYSQSQTNKVFSPPTTRQFLTIVFPAIITSMCFLLPHGLFHQYIPKHFLQEDKHCQPYFKSWASLNIFTLHCGT